MEELTKRKILAAVKSILGDPNPTTKDRENIKKDPNIKSQMQKMMGWRYPGQRLINLLNFKTIFVGIVGFIVFALAIGVAFYFRF